MDTIEFLLIFDLREITHDVRDPRIDRSLETRVVNVDSEPNVERFDGGLVFETVLNEPLNLACAESGEPRELVDDDKIIVVGLDLTPELAVLLTAILGSAGDDIGEHFDVFDHGELPSDVFAALFELASDVLFVGTDAGVDGSSVQVAKT